MSILRRSLSLLLALLLVVGMVPFAALAEEETPAAEEPSTETTAPAEENDPPAEETDPPADETDPAGSANDPATVDLDADVTDDPSIDKSKKTTLTSANGLGGYKLVEYGTVLALSSNLKGNKPLVLGPEYAKSNYAYKRGVTDPVFAQTADKIQYTNVLVGFTLDQCKEDIAMRPYMILENKSGEKITLYGGIVYRSIGYIAWQNRNVFQPGDAAYDYVWDIIHHVYGKKYDADYKG